MIESVLENPTETAVTGSTTRNAAASQAEGPLSSELLARINAYWRAANYLSVGPVSYTHLAVWSRSDHDSCAVGKPWGQAGSEPPAGRHVL